MANESKGGTTRAASRRAAPSGASLQGERHVGPAFTARSARAEWSQRDPYYLPDFIDDLDFDVSAVIGQAITTGWAAR